MKKLFFAFLILSINFVFGSEELSVSDIFEQNNTAVVYITQTLHFQKENVSDSALFQRMEEKIDAKLIDSYFPLSSGTGFIITNDGYLITNDHVINKDNLSDTKDIILIEIISWLRSSLPSYGFSRPEIQTLIGDFTNLIKKSTFYYRVKTYNKKEYTAEVIYSDTEIDLALLNLDTKDKFNISRFNDSKRLSVGDKIVAIGYPLQSSIESFLTDFQPTLSNGIVSALRSDNWGIQHTASINPGNSGGPLFNMRGNLVGINVGTVDGANDIYFSIPLSKLKDFLKNGYSDLISQNSSDDRLTASGEVIEIKPLTTGSSIFIKSLNGASVFLNDKFIGTSPLLIENISEGEHLLSINTDFQYHERSIVVEPGVTEIIEYAPILQKYKGNIYIQSKPSEAEVYLDGEYYGLSPKVISNINVGTHVLTLKKSDYDRVKLNIEVAKEKTVHQEIELIPAYGITLISYFGDNSIVFRNGNEIRDFQVNENIELPYGTWTLSLPESYYSQNEIAVSVSSDTNEINLADLLIASQIQINNLKPESKVYLDKKDITNELHNGRCHVNVGEYSLTIETANYITQEFKVNIKPDEIFEVNVPFILKPSLEAKKAILTSVPITFAGLALVVFDSTSSSYSDNSLSTIGTVGIITGIFFLGKGIYYNSKAERVSDPEKFPLEKFSVQWNDGVNFSYRITY